MPIPRFIDTSSELHVYRCGNGISLVRPGHLRAATSTFPMRDTKHTISSMLTLPMNIYFVREDNINQMVNEHDALLSGFDSVKNAIGKKCFANFTQKSSEITTQNDKAVMRSQKVKISEEDVILSNGNISRPTLSVKLPWYDQENKVIGIFGCSIVLGQHSLADSLSLVTNLGLLNSVKDMTSYVGTEINENYLSKRQLSCARLLLSGMTQKEIAAHLNLSPRTIETYMENLKFKLNCRNKTELIVLLTEILK
jgi:DNA-binding CsgD family transcriptional regulator